MKKIWLLISFSMIGFSACGQKTKPHVNDPRVVQLHKEATSKSIIANLTNKDSALKAIELLDSATSIDSNYFQAYYSKMMFLPLLDQKEKIKSTLNSLLRIKPFDAEIHMLAGYMYDNMNDTITSIFFTEKQLISAEVLPILWMLNSGIMSH